MRKNVGQASPRWALNLTYLIKCKDGSDYLFRRRLIQTPRFGIYVHDIYEADDGPPHNHPWSFVSIVLRGAYTEELHEHPMNGDGCCDGLCSYRQLWRRWSIHRMGKTSAHKILRADLGLKTLVIVGRRRKGSGWGFFTDEGYVPWEEYHGER